MSFTKHQRPSCGEKRLKLPNGLKHTDSNTHVRQKCMHMRTCALKMSLFLLIYFTVTNSFLCSIVTVALVFSDIRESVFTKMTKH